MKQRKAIIVGGSMAGLFAANMLHRAGWAVSILERSHAPLTGRGAGIVTHAGMLALLRQSGVELNPSSGVALTRRLTIAKSGEIRAQAQFDQILMGWSKLYALLCNALAPNSYHLDHAVTDVAFGDATHPPYVTCQSGEQFAADVVIGADGVRSLLRAKILRDEEAAPAPYLAWRGMVRISALSHEAQQLLAGAFLVVSEPGEQMVTYPVLGDDGDMYVNFVWYRLVTHQQRVELLSDGEGHYFAQGISPLAIQPQHRDKAKSDVAHIFHPHIAQLVQAAPDLLLQVIVDQSASCMAKGCVALIGDAAFVARPHVGQGVTKAGGDAWALTTCLQHPEVSVSQALLQFNDLRVPVGVGAVERARQLGAVLVPKQDTPANMLHWHEHYKNPMALLSDTAVELAGLAHI